MTRKDYIALADCIKNARLAKPESEQFTATAVAYFNAQIDIAENIAALCKKNNPRFNEDKFYRACGIEP